jgi:4a-hydroxytetrahydrobiopterin dehydratase
MSDMQTALHIPLADRKCVPCQGGTPPLKGEVLKHLVAEISPEWQVIEEHHLSRTFKFHDFKEALAFVNRVGALAEEENHHPEIVLSWGKVRIELFTHKIGGLSDSDLVMAAKIDRL